MNSNLIYCSLVALLLPLAAASAAVNLSVTTADGLGQDAFIAEGAPLVAEGNQDLLRLRFRSRADGNARTALVQFDLGFLDDEISAFGQARNDILSLTLTLSTGVAGNVEPDNVFGIYILADTSANDMSWDESTITWNNAPADARINSVNNDSPNETATLPAANSLVDDDRWYYLPGDGVFTFTTTDLLTAVQADTNNILTIAIQYLTDDISSSLNIASKEYDVTNGTNLRPTLNVEVIPEPSQFAWLLGTIALSCAVARRRTR